MKIKSPLPQPLTETKTRLGRNKSEENMNKGGEKEIKVTINKNEINTESKGVKKEDLK